MKCNGKKKEKGRRMNGHIVTQMINKIPCKSH